MANAIDYAQPGPLTSLASVRPAALKSLSGEPADISRPVHALVIQPRDAQPLGLGDDRLAENQVRPAAALIEALLALDPAPLDVARAPDLRAVGTRKGRVDAARFGVYGTGNFGPAEIRGNAVRDLAALNKAEMLPWNEWGRMAPPIRARPALTTTS